MQITIDMPQVGESVVEGIIARWLKAPGDRLKKYEPLVEVVTDKVTMDVPSPVSGVLVRVLVNEGDTVPMGAPIAEVETEEASQSHPATTRRGPASAVQERVPEKLSTTGYLVKDARPVGPTGGGVEEPVLEEHISTPIKESPRELARYSPAVRRLAREHNVDLSQVTGTGAGGRISRNDVLKHVEARTATGTPASAAGPPPITNLTIAKASIDYEEISLSPVRRIIAQNMAKSAAEIPHAWSMVEVDMTGMVGWREKLMDEFAKREGVGLTYLPFIIVTVGESLKEHPMLNSTWGGDKIVLKKGIHIGIAVSAPDGLVVPVLHNANALKISELAREVYHLTSKAREGKLTLRDVQGGTFTINNTGALGSVVSYPIINYPQAAILTTEVIQKRPVIVDDTIAIRSMMNVCLSFDHRIVDGAGASAFLQSVKRRMEAMGPDTAIY